MTFYIDSYPQLELFKESYPKTETLVWNIPESFDPELLNQKFKVLIWHPPLPIFSSIPEVEILSVASRIFIFDKDCLPDTIKSINFFGSFNDDLRLKDTSIHVVNLGGAPEFDKTILASELPTGIKELRLHYDFPIGKVDSSVFDIQGIKIYRSGLLIYGEPNEEDVFET